MEGSSFGQFLVELSNELDENDVKKLKTILKKDYKITIPASIKEPFDLFNALTDDAKISESNVDLLEEIFPKIGKSSLVGSLTEYKTGICYLPLRIN